MSEQKPVVILFLFFSLSGIILFLFNGTGLEADSINHYLFAKYAPQHPELFLDHWAKPLFTFLASPFAQFGFIGIKIFNILCASISCVLTYKICRDLDFKNAHLAPLFFFIFPISFTTTFSGLTEPLCAAILTYSIYLIIRKNYLWTALLIGLTPFIRSEGLLFIGVFGLFFLLKKQWKFIPLLLCGHLVFSLIGAFHHEDLLWVFSKIPYADLNSHYGSGKLFHFADKLNYLMGIPLLILFLSGLFGSFFLFNKMQSRSNQIIVFISAIFLVFFIAHSLFWYLGIFNSMGLKRVFAAITPLMAIVCLLGFNNVERINSNKIKTSLKVVIIVVVLFFPFTSNPAAIDWEDLNLTTAQNLANEVANYVDEEGIVFNRLIYTDPYLCEVFEIDPFGSTAMILAKKKVKPTNYELTIIEDDRFKYVEPEEWVRTELTPRIKAGDLIVWDNWHSVIDYDVVENDLKNLELLKSFKRGKSKYSLYIYQ